MQRVMLMSNEVPNLHKRVVRYCVSNGLARPDNGWESVFELYSAGRGDVQIQWYTKALNAPTEQELKAIDEKDFVDERSDHEKMCADPKQFIREYLIELGLIAP